MDTIRGHSLGRSALGLESTDFYEPRKSVVFACASCSTERAVVFAADAEVPSTWPCTHCGSLATPEGAPVSGADASGEEASRGKSPFEMLLERRSREELELILDERLAYLRERRGNEELD